MQISDLESPSEPASELSERLRAQEQLTDRLLLIVAEMAAGGGEYPHTQKGWAKIALDALSSRPNVTINRELRARLEQLRDRP